MRKHLATILIIAYLAFAPICFVVLPFLGGVGAHHASSGHIGHIPEAKSCGAVGECDPMPFDDIDQHAAMYHAATASTQSATALVVMSVMLFVVFFFVFVRRIVELSLLRTQARFDRLRQHGWFSKYEQFARWQSLLLNSPNHSLYYA